MDLDTILWRISVLQRRILIVSNWQELCWLRLELIDLKHNRDKLLNITHIK